MGDGNIHDGSALFFALYDTIEGNETEKLCNICSDRH